MNNVNAKTALMSRTKQMILAVSMLALTTLSGISCKTCKCPAYSDRLQMPSSNSEENLVQQEINERGLISPLSLQQGNLPASDSIYPFTPVYPTLH